MRLFLTASVKISDPISKAIRKVVRDPQLDQILTFGPFDGDCLNCARAIMQVWGGNLIRLVTYKYREQGDTLHYGVEIGSYCYDFEGGFSSKQAWKDYHEKQSREIFSDPTSAIPMVVEEGLEPGWIEGESIPQNPETISRLANLLVTHSK